MQEVKEEDKPPFPSVPTYDAKSVGDNEKIC